MWYRSKLNYTVGNAVPSNPNPTVGTTVTYRCKDGLVPYGNNFDNFQVRCGADQNFDLTGADLPECIPPGCYSIYVFS